MNYKILRSKRLIDKLKQNSPSNSLDFLKRENLQTQRREELVATIRNSLITPQIGTK